MKHSNKRHLNKSKNYSGYTEWFHVNMIWDYSIQDYDLAEEEVFDEEKYNQLVNDLTKHLDVPEPTIEDYNEYQVWVEKNKNQLAKIRHGLEASEVLKKNLEFALNLKAEIPIKVFKYEISRYDKCTFIENSAILQQYYDEAKERYEVIHHKMMQQTFYHSRFRVPGAIIKIRDCQQSERTVVLGDVDMSGDIGSGYDEFDNYPGNRWTVLAVKLPTRNFVSRIRK